MHIKKKGTRMQCPVCNDASLVMSERQGIEIDYCPKCRGVWLDRGELDKIIERTLQESSSPEPPQEYSRPAPVQHRDDRKYYDYDNDKYYGKHRKRKGFLGDIFDFD